MRIAVILVTMYFPCTYKIKRRQPLPVAFSTQVKRCIKSNQHFGVVGLPGKFPVAEKLLNSVSRDGAIYFTIYTFSNQERVTRISKLFFT